MNGAESLVETLLRAGVDTCFANPGTSEMHFVAALDREPRMRCVLALFEGVATGAADGYARVTGKPAAVLLHCAPGLGNGLANLHNAKRGNTPVVNIVGDHATYHSRFDPPLAGNTAGWAEGVSVWTRTSDCAEDVGADAASAVQAATAGAGGVATLILPSDASWNPGGIARAPLPSVAPAPVAGAAVDHAAMLLREGGGDVLLLLDGPALRGGAIADAARICGATDARMLAITMPALLERGAGLPAIGRLPYSVDLAAETLAAFRTVILVGAVAPVAFFAYPGKPSLLACPDATVYPLARPGDDAESALAALADALGVANASVPAVTFTDPGVPSGPVTPAGIGQVLTALLPEHSIVVDEAITLAQPLFSATVHARRHDWLMLTGGAIGAGIPMATGAALGGNGRRVVNLQADGSALYTLQGLWTQARERLPVTTVILDNRKYAVLVHELSAVGANHGPKADSMMSLDDPAVDWVALARGFGVDAARADTLDDFARLLAASFERDGPYLIALATG